MGEWILYGDPLDLASWRTEGKVSGGHRASYVVPSSYEYVYFVHKVKGPSVREMVEITRA